MFGISYDYTKVHYEPMPVSVRHICPSYEKGTFWTYAHVKRGSVDYFVVMGIRPGQDGDSFGAAVAVEGTDCEQEDSLRMLSGFVPQGGYGQGQKEIALPGLDASEVCDQGECHYVFRSAAEEGLLRDLVRDALTRGAKAWGDAERFKSEVCKPSVQEANKRTPIVLEELKEFCGVHP